MSRQVDISKLNPHKMVEVAVRPAKYHQGNINNELQQFLIRRWEEKKIFKLPVERLQPFRFVFIATTSISRTLQIINGRGEVKLTIPLTDSIDVGNISDTGEQMTQYVYKRANLNGLAAGTYYVLLTINFDAITSRQYVSEPFDLQTIHRDTCYFEYWNTFNRDDVFFEQLPVRFGIRLKSKVDLTTPGVNATTFEDSATRLQLLDARPFRNWELMIGGNGTGVAKWVCDKLNNIFCCDSVFIDGTQFRRPADAAWEETAVDNVPVYGYKLALREADESAASTFIDSTLDLFTIPADPFAVGSASIQSTGLYGASLNNTATIIDAGPQRPAQLASLVAAMNAYASFQELGGTVSLSADGTKLIYTNGLGERYVSASVKLITTFFGFTYASQGFNPILSFMVRRAGGVVDWGDGTVSSIQSTVSSLQVSHTYGALAANFNVRIFSDNMEVFQIAEPQRIGLTGTLPANLKLINIIGGSFTNNSINWQLLYTAPKLETMSLRNAGLTTGTAGLNQLYFPALKYVDFSGNALPSFVQGNITYDIWYNASNNGANSPLIAGGVFSIGGQTNGQGLDAKGRINRDKLRAAPLGWTVNE